MRKASSSKPTRCDVAYLVSVKQKCCDCTRIAVVELRGNRNQTFGVFCKAHGDMQLKRLNAEEEKERAKRDEDRNRQT